MIALAIFATGTVAVAELLQRSQTGQADGENALIATQLARRRLEELRNVAYASVVSESKAAVTTPSGFSHYSREVTVTTPFTNLKQVVVTVYWTDSGVENSLSLQTYRSNV